MRTQGTDTIKPTILVVDDDEGVREVIRTALSDYYRVVEAGDGFYGLSEVMVGDPPVDAIITDLHMPGCDGVELIEDLPEGIPVIIISAYLKTPGYQQALKHLHPVAIIEKPFKMSDLCQTLKTALNH